MLQWEPGSWPRWCLQHFSAVGRVCAANSAALGGRPPGGVYSVERCFVALYETE
jgi:hypothetical protein